MIAQEFVKTIATEKDGFQFDEAWRISEESLSVIVPITRKSRRKRKYITLAEAQDVKVEDTGQIDFVRVENNEDKPLLVSRGEIFRGKSQERAAIHGQIIMPGKGARINVRCVHASKGINPGTKMEYGGKTPYDIDFSSQRKTWDSVSMHNTMYCSSVQMGDVEELEDLVKSSKRRRTEKTNKKIKLNRKIKRNPARRFYEGSNEKGLGRANQTVTYSSNLNCMDTNAFNDEDMDCASPVGVAFAGAVYSDEPQDIPASDDLVDALDDMTDFIKDAMKKIPLIKNQVGAVFLYENKIKGMDIYDLPDSWKSVKEDIVKKEGSDYLKKEDVNIFEFKPEKVKQLIGKELSCKFKEKVVFGETQKLPFKIIEIREVRDEKKNKNGKLLIGEAVEFEGQIIHLTMSRI